MFFQLVQQSSERLFAAYIVIATIFIPLEIRVVLIDCIVSKMSVFGLHVLQTITLGCKPSQPFFISVYFQRIDSCNDHIDSQVELQVVYQKRVANVLAYYHLLALLFVTQLLKVVGQKYAFALR